MRQRRVEGMARSELPGLVRVSDPAQKDPAARDGMGVNQLSPFIADAQICSQKYNFFPKSDHK